MHEYMGYYGDSLKFLKSNKISISDSVQITINNIIKYHGIIMPRYNHMDDKHIVLKLKNGYNIGIEIINIEKIEKNQDNIVIDTKSVENEEKKEKKELPKILLMSTGGTIASKVDYRTGAVTPILTAKDLNAYVPELNKIANIDTKVLFAEYSENIMPKHWLQIAKEINKYLNSDYKGIIIAHGTDTMHYTSAFLSFALAGFPIPIVLVGSQRSSDRASSDAAMNLIGATRFITESNTKGVYVVMHKDENDDIISCHIGTRVRKNHTSKRGAFKTIGKDEPAFLIGKEIKKNLTNNFYKINDYTPRINLNTKIALIKYYPGYNIELINQIIDMEYKGIIFEGTGLGHVGNSIYSSIKKAKEKGIFLGMTSQCLDGRVRMTVYESGRDLLDLGIVPLKDMIPEVALVKAMWALGNFDDKNDIKQIMLNNIASELSN